MSQQYYLYYGHQQKLNKHTPFFKKLFRFILRPRETLFDEVFSLGEGLLALGLLILVSMLQQLFLMAYYGDFSGWLTALGGVLLQVPLVWLFFSLVYHFGAYLFKGTGKFVDILGLMAYASFPLTLFTLFSLLLGAVFWLLLPAFDPTGMFFSLIYLAGLLWGWLGFLAFSILRWGEGLSLYKALIIVLVFLLIYSAGFFVPV